MRALIVYPVCPFSHTLSPVPSTILEYLAHNLLNQMSTWTQWRINLIPVREESATAGWDWDCGSRSARIPLP